MPEIQFLTFKKFNKIIENGVAVIDFSAPWCSPCRVQRKIMAQLEKTYDGKALFLDLNLDNCKEVALNLAIQSIPSIIIFKNGKEIRRFVGLQPGRAIGGAVDRAIHLYGE